MNLDIYSDPSLVILTATLAVWTVALVLDIKSKSSRLTILIDILVIIAAPVYEYLYLKIPLIDVLTINGFVFLLVFLIGYNILGVKKAGKTLEEVEAEIVEIESKERGSI